MTEEMLPLARRAVACRDWRWMLGARWIVTRAAPLEDYAGRIVEGGRRAPDGPGLPDLSDPATMGCLLALVREVWGQDDMSASRYREQWCVEVTPQEAQNYAFYGASEAEALVAALEGAP